MVLSSVEAEMVSIPLRGLADLKLHQTKNVSTCGGEKVSIPLRGLADLKKNPPNSGGLGGGKIVYIPLRGLADLKPFWTTSLKRGKRKRFHPLEGFSGSKVLSWKVLAL